MRNSCLSLLRQGWLGLPLFFVGLVTLAFSQFEAGEEGGFKSATELSEEIETILKSNDMMLGELRLARKNLSIEEQDQIGSEIQRFRAEQGSSSPELEKLEKKFSEAQTRLSTRLSAIDQRVKISDDRLTDSKEIFSDIRESFGGNIDDAQPSLLALHENLSGAQSELLALSEMLDGISKDFVYELSTLNTIVNNIAVSEVPEPPSVDEAKPVVVSDLSAKNRIFNGLQIVENPAHSKSRLEASIQPTNPKLQLSGNSPKPDVQDVSMIEKLRSELESSKTVQTELSKDSADLNSDLRKAYREIVSLQTNLKESQLLIQELEKNKQSLYKTDDGSPATVNTVSKRIVRLEKELDLARDDLRQSRQSLLLEQKRSSAMIESITSELGRTRAQLDQARLALHNNGGDSTRMAFLERELAETKRALEMAQEEPIDPDSGEYVNLQNELRKSLGEIARMQIELGHMEELKDELAQVKSSMEQMSGSRGANPEFVNKLIVELNAANTKIEELQSGNAGDRDGLSDGITTLEEELFATKKELEMVRKQFAQTKEQIAQKEFEFATTIKNLEEEAQLVQADLQDSSKNPVLAIPFISEMEDSLSSSESRIRLLSEQFANEQARATEVIETLNEELALAQARHKETLNLLSRREFDLQGKGKEIAAIEKEKKDLEEELQVVKVIVGQLNDLNQVLEETKETQFVQNTDSSELVSSLREELNRLKVELVVVSDDRDNLEEEFTENIANLKRELDDVRNQMIEEQEVYAASTSESKIIVVDLKRELDKAREQIAELKSVGFSDEVETQSAVAQLQEALGTIKILKESLDEAEEANLEVDNLKTELAEVMSTQLDNLQKQDDEKKFLIQQVQNLETEIAVLRENSTGSVASINAENQRLKADLKVAKLELSTLEKQLSESEYSEIQALAEMEDELSALKNANASFKKDYSSVSSTDAQTIARLENELSKAVAQLNMLEATDSNDEQIAVLERRLKDSEFAGTQALLVLEEELAELKNDNISLKNQLSSIGPKSVNIAELQDENDRLSDQLVLLNNQLAESKRKSAGADAERVRQLELQLENAIAQIDNLPTDQPNFSDAELELTMAQQAIEELTKSLDSRDRDKADLTNQLNSAMEKIALLEANRPSPAQQPSMDQLEEIAGLQMEIDLLRAELNLAREDSAPPSAQNEDLSEIQEELRNAVAESFELQMELEQTQVRLSEMEEKLAQQPQGTLDQTLEQRKLADLEAQQRIEELTNALRNSEQLRSETEDLLTEMERNAKAGGQDISKDPRFLALQQEMIGLQNDLIAAQQMDDPRVIQLEGALEASRADAAQLNSEFKGVMADFTNLRDELTALEAENRRIREISLSQAREQSNPAAATMQIEINNLSRENANLMAQLSEKDRRISGLRDDLAGSARNPNESELRSQLVQLQIQNQSLANSESQAKRENQQLRQDLSAAREDATSLQSRVRELDRQNQSPLNRVSPDQIAELENLRTQNALLENQLKAFAQGPSRDNLESKIRDLNQQNMNFKIQLDREKIMVDDLKDQLADARSVKQEVLERGKSSKLKIDLLNEELSGARSRVDSLEKALVAARQAIRVLQGGGSGSTLIPVSNPSTFSSNIGRTGSSLPRSSSTYLPSRRIQLPDSLGDRSSMLQLESERSSLSSLRSPSSASVQNSAIGNSNLRIQAKVQFLDNKNRPAGFTEFFLVEDNLDSILAADGIRVPTGEGIQSPAEYWARSVQRGYRFPGVAAKIRNALARASLKRIKTNSLGEGNLDNLRSGRYYIVGASTLGQVGVVWSKPITLNSGDNQIDLDLRNAIWAQ